jgi:septation ring formation regulator EzrA
MNPPDHPTPRTNAIAHRGYPEPAYIVEITDLARTLERELTAANKGWQLSSQSNELCLRELYKVRDELAAEQAERERLNDGLKMAEAMVRATTDRSDTFRAELARLRAELASKTACYDIACGEVQRLRAEVERFKEWLADPHNLHAHCLRTLTEGQIAHLFGERMTAIVNRAEKAEAELADWSVLKGWGGTPEIVHKFIKGQQNRIHHCQDLEAELTALAAERDQLRAEVDRANDIINRASVQFFHDGTDGQTAAKMLTVLNETKLLKNETNTP